MAEAEQTSSRRPAGPGSSDYERYLRTEELLSLQKGPGDWAHRDELLFQTVHQSSELWLKHAWVEVEEATRLIEARDARGARAARPRDGGRVRVGFLEHLERMSPWEYQDVRRVLGHGSGFDSPGFREIRRVSPPLSRPSTGCGASAASRCSRSTCTAASTRISTSSPSS